MKQIYIYLLIFVILYLLNRINILHYKNNNPNIAICFFGLCKSTDYTIDSINKYIFDPLTKLQFNYDIYLHTFNVNKPYSNKRNNEDNTILNNDLYKLLNPIKYIIEDDDKIKESIDFLKYRTHGDPWNNNYNSLDNVILALYSLNQVTELWKNSNKKYDYIMYLRPDVLFLQPLKLSYFTQINNSNIILPNFHEYPVNDRFAIGVPDIMQLYGERYNNAHNYSLLNKLHAEQYLHYILSINSITVIKINFKFSRIRANGKIDDRDKFDVD